MKNLVLEVKQIVRGGLHRFLRDLTDQMVQLFQIKDHRIKSLALNFKDFRKSIITLTQES